jgi:hypothetical protein
MTGTSRSNPFSRVVAALGLAAVFGCAPAGADTLLLTGDERLSGTVRAIHADGTVLLDTPLSPDPVGLKAESVRKVLFSDQPDRGGAGNCLLTLANGDTLPGTIEEIDEKQITLASGPTGRLVVPRTVVASLQPGLSQPLSVYQGPKGFEGWQRDRDTADQWQFDKGVFRVTGTSKITRELELPEAFIVRFKVAWRNVPKMEFSFAAAEAADGGARDRYFFQFNSAGVQIRRESSTGKQFHQVMTANRLPQQFDGRQVPVEIRVDRRARRLQLWLNGELEGKYEDPLPKAPAGRLIVFSSTVEQNEVLSFSDIEVLDWTDKSDRRPAGERGDRTKDALVSSEGERFGGSLLQTRKGEEGTVYVFRNAFQQQPIEVPEAAVSAIFFADTPEGAAGRDKGLFSLRLLGGGRLRVGECVFFADHVEATHPLLGKLRFERGFVTAFERKAEEPTEGKEKS